MSISARSSERLIISFTIISVGFSKLVSWVFYVIVLEAVFIMEAFTFCNYFDASLAFS